MKFTMFILSLPHRNDIGFNSNILIVLMSVIMIVGVLIKVLGDLEDNKSGSLLTADMFL